MIDARADHIACLDAIVICKDIGAGGLHVLGGGNAERQICEILPYLVGVDIGDKPLGVVMGVDEPRHHRLARDVDDAGTVGNRHAAPGTHGLDAVVANHYICILDDFVTPHRDRPPATQHSNSPGNVPGDFDLDAVLDGLVAFFRCLRRVLLRRGIGLRLRLPAARRLNAVVVGLGGVEVVHHVCIAYGPVHAAAVRAPRRELSAHVRQLPYRKRALGSSHLHRGCLTTHHRHGDHVEIHSNLCQRLIARGRYEGRRRRRGLACTADTLPFHFDVLFFISAVPAERHQSRLPAVGVDPIRGRCEVGPAPAVGESDARRRSAVSRNPNELGAQGSPESAPGLLNIPCRAPLHHDAVSIGRPRRLAVERSHLRQAPGIAPPVGPHLVELSPLRIVPRYECDPPPVRRPRGLILAGTHFGQPPRRAVRVIHYVELVQHHEGETLSVR